MISRCKYPSQTYYKNYGGRGITVCERWQGVDGLFNFAVDMGDKPTPKHTLDRIDNDGNYGPSNCRWATQIEQMKNARPRGDNSRNTSGIRGVWLDKSKNKWRASVIIGGTRHWSQYYSTPEEANKWRIKCLANAKQT
jgi:hypothetical protein